MYCNLNYVYSGMCKKNRIMQYAMRKRFMKKRSKLVEVLNSGITELANREFNASHEWYKGIYESEEYMRFMRNTYTACANRINAFNRFRWFELYITKDCDIAGRLRMDHNSTIEMYLTNLREEP